MLQALLEDRFRLIPHKDTKHVTGYVLTAGRKPALKRAGDREKSGCAQQASALGVGLPVAYNCRNTTMAAFVQGLNSLFGAPGTST